MTDAHILDRIDAVLRRRKLERPGDSYTASLYRRGTPAILEKISEEADEVVAAGDGEGDARLVSEVADLWFHCQVLLAQRNLGVSAVFGELERRFGKSGLAEKRERAG
jgi:phosphoribosyl-ATP pyrophosphohydrolase